MSRVPEVPPSRLRLPGGHEVDFDAAVLRRVDGSPVALRPQVWSLLRLLACQPGALVSKAQLIEALWPDAAVGDESLAQAVSDLRAALGDDAHRIVRTLSRRGYLLVAEAAGGIVASALAALPPLPPPVGPLFGRDSDLEALVGWLGKHRLVTITGAGGIGKTVFGLAAARRHAAAAGLPAAWLDLARLADAALLPSTLANALALPVAPSGDALPGLLTALRSARVLLVLDNAEHLVADVAAFARTLLDAAPGLQLLVTSQVPLHLRDEHLFRLAALDVPAPGTTPATAARAGAVALFIEQVRSVDRRFDLTADNVGAVIDLCRALDGLPLAIRLAAARQPLLGLAGIGARLGERLLLLRGDGRDAPSRQQTLAAALEWSCSLLSEQERALFRQLGIFVGGFGVELAAAFAAQAGVDEWALIERLESLAERSLVETRPGEPPRYHLLETPRAYALLLLEHAGEGSLARRRHAHAVAQVFGRIDDDDLLRDDAVVTRLAPDLDNARAALDWCADHEPPTFAALAAGVQRLFRQLDLSGELRRRAALVEAAGLPALEPGVASRYWLARASLEAGTRVPAMRDFAARAEAEARTADDRGRLFASLCLQLSSGLLPVEQAAKAWAEVQAIEATGDLGARWRSMRSLAEWVLAARRGEWSAALRAAERGLSFAVEVHAAWLEAIFANWVLVSLIGLQRNDEAESRSRALAAQARAAPTTAAIPFFGTRARCALLVGDLHEARQRLAHMFELCRIVDWSYFDFFAGLYVQFARAEGRDEDAALLLGHAETALARAGSSAPSTADRRTAAEAVAAAIGSLRLVELMDEGRGLDREQACALVLRAHAA